MCVCRGEKSLFSALSPRTLPPRRLCVRIQTRSLALPTCPCESRRRGRRRYAADGTKPVPPESGFARRAGGERNKQYVPIQSAFPSCGSAAERRSSELVAARAHRAVRRKQVLQQRVRLLPREVTPQRGQRPRRRDEPPRRLRVKPGDAPHGGGRVRRARLLPRTLPVRPYSLPPDRPHPHPPSPRVDGRGGRENAHRFPDIAEKQDCEPTGEEKHHGNGNTNQAAFFTSGFFHLRSTPHTLSYSKSRNRHTASQRGI